MDEIATRLKETSETCVKCYESWSKDKKNNAKEREDLLEAVHELRKVAARLEIEMAISERDEMAAKPIPIPPHRSSRRRNQNNNDDGGGNNAGQNNGGGNSGPKVEKKSGGRSGGAPRKKRTGTQDSE